VLADIALYIVAAVFIFTGLIKCFSIKGFVAYTASHPIYEKVFKFFPHIIAIEITLGVALALKVSPFILIIIAMVMIFTLTILKCIEWLRYSETQCACYGPLVALPIKISIILNIVYLCLCGYAFFNINLADSWSGRPAGMFLCFLYFAFFIFVLFMYKHPEWQIQFLKVGRSWKNRWLDIDEKPMDCLYVFLSSECDNCEAWMNHMRHWKKETHGEVKLVVEKNKWDKDKQLNLGLGHFGLVELSSFKLSLLLEKTPLAIQVKNEKIEERFEDSIQQYHFKQQS
jgi:hypothetical protein